MGRGPCYHRWSRTGRCTQPACDAQATPGAALARNERLNAQFVRDRGGLVPEERRRRPTHTVVVPNAEMLIRTLSVLIANAQTFTAEPSPTEAGVWQVGVMDSGVSILLKSTAPDTTADE